VRGWVSVIVNKRSLNDHTMLAFRLTSVCLKSTHSNDMTSILEPGRAPPCHAYCTVGTGLVRYTTRLPRPEMRCTLTTYTGTNTMRGSLSTGVRAFTSKFQLIFRPTLINRDARPFPRFYTPTPPNPHPTPRVIIYPHFRAHPQTHRFNSSRLSIMLT
jgi:hypothetical protein